MLKAFLLQKRGAIVEGLARPKDQNGSVGARIKSAAKGLFDKLRYRKVVEKAQEAPNGRVVKWGRTYKQDRLQGVKQTLESVKKQGFFGKKKSKRTTVESLLF